MSAECHAPTGTDVGVAVREVHEQPGHYLTDGSRLLRALRPADLAKTSGLIGLEDCLSLEIILVPASALRGWRLTLVRTPAPPA